MSEANYNHVVSEIKTLNLSDQLRLLEQMAAIIRQRTSTGSTRSILELKGKGKESLCCRSSIAPLYVVIVNDRQSSEMTFA